MKINKLKYDFEQRIYVAEDGYFVDKNGFRHYLKNGKISNNYEIEKFDGVDDFEIKKAYAFIKNSDLIKIRKTINHNYSSYGLKHKAENWLRKQPLVSEFNCYVSNGAFIIAMSMLGFSFQTDKEYFEKLGYHSLNVFFNCSFNSRKFNELHRS